ncbi:MAG: NAD(P)/FAD-dependent oxidoreductase, partial [Shewanella sp.]
MASKPPVHSEQYPQSYYVDTAKEIYTYPQLEGNINADVCIVGGGFSGINTAIELAQRGMSVVLLEARRIGWGASGRNGGELIRGIGHDPAQFQNEIGTEGVQAIEQMGFEAVEIVRNRIQEHSIDCDLQMGYCDLAVKPRHMDELEEEFSALKAMGYQQEIKLLTKAQLGEVIG